MISVAFEHFERWHDECIFVLDKFLEELDVVWVSKVVLSETVDVIHQLMLTLWQGTLWTLMVVNLFLSKSD